MSDSILLLFNEASGNSNKNDTMSRTRPRKISPAVPHSTSQTTPDN